MNIVKLVISFCDHCVLLCNKCAKCLGYFFLPPMLLEAASLDAFTLVVDQLRVCRKVLIGSDGVCSLVHVTHQTSLLFSLGALTPELTLCLAELFRELALDKSTLNVSPCVDYKGRLEGPLRTNSLIQQQFAYTDVCQWFSKNH